MFNSAFLVFSLLFSSSHFSPAKLVAFLVRAVRRSFFDLLFGDTIAFFVRKFVH